MRTLFLDFDGVLHPEFCHESRHFSCLPFFEQVLRATADIDVVVSSTWRQQYSLDELRSRFSTDVAHRVIGVTPEYKHLVDVPDSLLGYEREALVLLDVCGPLFYANQCSRECAKRGVSMNCW